MTYDLKKVEAKFHEYLRANLSEEYRVNEIKISEDLLEQQGAFYIPYGWVSYFLVIEDEKPVIYVNACTRMDIDIICFVDENGYEDYDLWAKDLDDEIANRYFTHAKNVKRCPYDDLKYIGNVKR